MEYTLEQLNFFRICCIAFNLVPEGLRKVFKQEWDIRYKVRFAEWTDTPQNGRDFFNNESRKSHTKNGRYLVTIQNSSTAEWDCSCLVFAILFSDSIGSTLGPLVRKHIDDLRQIRNEIAHISEAKLTDTEFHIYVGRVLHAFNALSLPINDIETVKNQKSFPTAEVDSLKKQVANLLAELQKAKSDFQNAKDTIKAKEDENVTLACDLKDADDKMERQQEQVECLTQEINSKLKSFCNLTFKPPHKIIRRTNDVTRIMRKMQELKDELKGAVSTIYLSGNPGCGKSQIARQIGEQFFTVNSAESDGLIFVATLNVETLKTLADSYETVATQLGVPEYTLCNLTTTNVGSPTKTIQHLQRLIMPKIKQFSEWLIIADNVADLSLVRSYLPQTASDDWGHGQLLISTQDSSVIPTSAPHTYHESLSAGMQSEDAVELLKQVSQISNNEQVEQVAEDLEFQPLALAAAAYYVRTVVSGGSPYYTWMNFLVAVSHGEREATEGVLAAENAAYPKTMTTTIEMAIKNASKNDEVLQHTFFLLSLISSESLPVDVAVNFVKNRTSNLTEELIKATILKSSLITCLYSEDGTPEYLTVHNIAYQVLKNILAVDYSFSEKVRSISDAIQVFSSLTAAERNNLFQSGHVCVKLRKVMAHCKVLHDVLITTLPEKALLLKELAPFFTPDTFVSWLCTTAAVCCDLSNPVDANLFSTTACELAEYIGNSRESRLVRADAFAVHGKVLMKSCRDQLSLSYLKNAAEIYTTIHGEEHPKLTTAYNDMGKVYCITGNYHVAKECYEKALIISKKVYCEEHADVATSYNNLGVVHSELGKNNEAKDYYEKALTIRKTIFDEEHADVATSYNSLGVINSDLGKYNEAKEYHEKALTISKKIYDEEHADVATSYNNLGVVYSDLEKYNEAKEYHEKALTIRKKIYEEEHPDVATSYNNLGVVYSDLEKYNEAKEYHEKALTISKRIYEEEHPDVAKSYSNLGAVYSDLGNNNEAKEYTEKALTIRKKIYEEEHADVATSYNNMGVVYNDLGKYDEAKEYYEKALTIRKKIYEEEHPDVATSYNNLGAVYRDLGKYNEAKQYYEKALAITKKIHEEEHADVARSYNSLGIVYRCLGKYNKAKEYHEKALTIRKKIYEEEHADVARSYNNLGAVYSDLGKYNKAKEYYEKALTIRKTIFDEEHADVASSYNNLGAVYSHLGKDNEAKECTEKALTISKKIYEEEHADVATSYNNVGVVYSALGKYNEAKEYYEKALTIRKKVYEEEHPDVATSYNNLGAVSSHLGKNNEAKEYHEKALTIRKKIYEEEHADVATSYNNLGAVYSHLGKYNEAKEYYEKALTIRKKIHKEEHADVARSYNNLGAVYSDLGKYNEAKEYHEKALTISKKINEEEHADVARSYNNL